MKKIFAILSCTLALMPAISAGQLWVRNDTNTVIRVTSSSHGPELTKTYKPKEMKLHDDGINSPQSTEAIDSIEWTEAGKRAKFHAPVTMEIDGLQTITIKPGGEWRLGL